MAVYKAEFTHTDGKIPVRTRFRLVYKNTARTVHGLDGKVFLVDHRCIHIFFIMIPVSRRLPEMTAQHNGRGDFHIACLIMDFSPVVKKSVLKNHSVWQEEGEPGALLTHHEQSQFFSEFSVVALLCLFDHSQILFQFCFLRKCGTVDPLEHFVVLVASPVCACKACQLECLYRFCRHQMRACAQIRKFPLGIETDGLVFGKILDQFYLVGLVFLFKILNGLISGHSILFDLQVFLDDLFHLRLDLFQIFHSKRSLSVHIIVKSVSNRRPDGKLCLRVQPLDSLSHNVGCSMAERAFSFVVVKCQDIQSTIVIHYGSQIYDLAVHLSGCCHSGKSFA